jgi:hypothetical protein
VYRRLLCYIEPGETRLEELEGLLDLTVQLQSRLIVLAILPEEPAKPSKEEKEKRDILEDRIWNFLYEIEDVAFGRELKISLMLEEGRAEETIASVAKSYEADLCATLPYKELDIELLLQKLGKTPLLVFNQEG